MAKGQVEINLPELNQSGRVDWVKRKDDKFELNRALWAIA